jgi:hypothetical protein
MYCLLNNDGIADGAGDLYCLWSDDCTANGAGTCTACEVMIALHLLRSGGLHLLQVSGLVLMVLQLLLQRLWKPFAMIQWAAWCKCKFYRTVFIWA